MSSTEEAGTIATRFAIQYGIDLKGIRKDTSTFRALLAAPTVDPQAITDTCYTYTGSGADVPDLEDARSAQGAVDGRLSPRLVELNLDEASKYAQSCNQLRTEYGSIAKQRNDTRYKGEEFVRLDEVHAIEVSEGLYKLPWQEASDERMGLEAAVVETTKQANIPDEMLSAPNGKSKYAGALTESIVRQNVDSNAFITKNTANSNKEQVGTSALYSWNYRSGIELATWLQGQAVARSTLSQLKAKLSVVQRREDFLRKDEGFRLQRASISRNLAWRQIAEHCRPGSPLNYDERLKAIKAQYDVALALFVERARVLSIGAKECYDIELPLPALQVGSILDNLSVWLVTLGDAIAKAKRTQVLSLLQIPVEVPPTSGALEVSVSVDRSMVQSERYLLRGVNFEYRGSSDGPLNISVAAPRSALLWNTTPPLRFGRVCAVAPGLDIRPQFSDQLWNGSPFGEWRLFSSAPTNGIDSVLMYMWVVA